MRKQLKAALAATLALLLALTVVPASALPRFDAKAEITPSWTVPAGYNVHDYTKCVEFLEQTDEDGVKNGDKLSDNYDPNDPETWFVDHDNSSFVTFGWTGVNGEKRLSSVHLGFPGIAGELDVSDCTALKSVLILFTNTTKLDVSGCTALETIYGYDILMTELDISGCTALEDLSFESIFYLNEIDASGCTALRSLWLYETYDITELDLTGCSALKYLLCSGDLTELDVTSCPALVGLHCAGLNLTELDVTGCPALVALDCSGNNITELDLSQNPALENLSCDGLTELDLSNNPGLAYDHVRAEGSGFVSYCYGWFSYPYEGGGYYFGYLDAFAANGAEFEGFYDENGALVSEGESLDSLYRYTFMDEDQWYNDDYEIPTGTIIARFSGGFIPGDVDGNGSVSVADAITTLRLAMQLADGSGLNTDAADMDGNGSITIADAIMVLRVAMGLA
ncbi:MAG: hypothetical protein IKZ82_10065 [Clostridia bacterium]|nr:hypothetical protein [Clostridia bacterium]